MDSGGGKMEREIREKYEKLTKTLIQKHLTITTIESCTSGQIASLITDAERAFIPYSNKAKIRQKVPEEIIEQFAVYSRKTACAASFIWPTGLLTP